MSRMFATFRCMVQGSGGNHCKQARNAKGKLAIGGFACNTGVSRPALYLLRSSETSEMMFCVPPCGCEESTAAPKKTQVAGGSSMRVVVKAERHGIRFSVAAIALFVSPFDGPNSGWKFNNWGRLRIHSTFCP